MRVAFADDGEPVQAELCLSTNDADEPVQTVLVADSSTNSSVPVGEPAPEFLLQAFDGSWHALSDHLGSPVLLTWFASW